MRLSLLCALASTAALTDAQPSPPTCPSFYSVFGDNMLLQQAPAHSAVYGFLDYAASMANVVVKLSLTPYGGVPTTLQATINTTVQTFGPDWGVRPCLSCPDINPPFNPFNSPLASWKVVLPPVPAGRNYSIAFLCDTCSPSAPTTATISYIVFGDMWLLWAVQHVAARAAHVPA